MVLQGAWENQTLNVTVEASYLGGGWVCIPVFVCRAADQVKAYSDLFRWYLTNAY